MATASDLRAELGRLYDLHRALGGRLRSARGEQERVRILDQDESTLRRIYSLSRALGLALPRDAWIYTPGAIRDEQDTVLGLVQQLDTDIQASNARPEFKAAWGKFRDEYKSFYEDSGWWARWWISSYEKTLEYRRRVVEWRQEFESQGGKATGPAPSASPEPPSDSHLGTYLAIAGGAIAVGALWWLVGRQPSAAVVVSQPERRPSGR
jgi:hypothetical protein